VLPKAQTQSFTIILQEMTYFLMTKQQKSETISMTAGQKCLARFAKRVANFSFYTYRWHDQSPVVRNYRYILF